MTLIDGSKLNTFVANKKILFQFHGKKIGSNRIFILNAAFFLPKICFFGKKPARF
jgi:hypothetical protein